MLADLIAANRKQHDQALARMVSASAARVPAFAARLAAAGLDPAAVRGSGDVSRLPVFTKTSCSPPSVPPPRWAEPSRPTSRCASCSARPVRCTNRSSPAPTRGAGPRRCAPPASGPATAF